MTHTALTTAQGEQLMVIMPYNTHLHATVLLQSSGDGHASIPQLGEHVTNSAALHARVRL
jgi:hypothetical protein